MGRRSRHLLTQHFCGLFILMKYLDFNHGSSNLWLSRLSGRAVKLFVGSAAPRQRVIDPTNAIQSQFVLSIRWVAVASQDCLTLPRKRETNGLRFTDSQGCLRATGCMLQRYTPTSRQTWHSKSVPGCHRRKATKSWTSLVPTRMAVCLEGGF